MPKYSRDEAIALLERGVVKFEVLQRICDTFFELKKISGSHHIYMTGYPDAVNIQVGPSGDAKRYQQQQVVALLRRQKGE